MSCCRLRVSLHPLRSIQQKSVKGLHLRLPLTTAIFPQITFTPQSGNRHVRGWRPNSEVRIQSAAIF